MDVLHTSARAKSPLTGSCRLWLWNVDKSPIACQPSPRLPPLPLIAVLLLSTRQRPLVYYGDRNSGRPLIQPRSTGRKSDTPSQTWERKRPYRRLCSHWVMLSYSSPAVCILSKPDNDPSTEKIMCHRFKKFAQYVYYRCQIPCNPS